jgi:hypothetical protein
MSIDDLRVLQRFVGPRPERRAGERCEMCAIPIAEEHQHLVDLKTRNLVCACRPCYLLFPSGGAEVRYRAVPDRYARLGDFQLSAGQWDGLQIPVGVAFLFRNSEVEEWVAFYPSPAGATESLLDLDSWRDVEDANPALREILPDVEAALVRQTREMTACYIVPIDACYELVGLLRQLWKGFDGGTEANEALGRFFARVEERAETVSAR